MQDRPIKGNASGKYNMQFIDPTNDICAYYGGMTELEDLVENYLETITFHRLQNPAIEVQSKVYSSTVKQESYLDHCSVCLQKFKQGQEVKVLPCKHCFHKECVTPWFSTHNHCPNCRYQLPLAQ